jgi:hypothetical protein
MQTQKIFMPTFSIPQLRSKAVLDFGVGNLTAFKRTVDILTKAGIKGVCLLPITEINPDDASLFGRVSNNALSHSCFWC